jgi:hypothetical protein
VTRGPKPRGFRATSRLGGRAPACSTLRRRTAVGTPGRPAVRPLRYGARRLFKRESVVSLCVCPSRSPPLPRPGQPPVRLCHAAARAAEAAAAGRLPGPSHHPNRAPNYRAPSPRPSPAVSTGELAGIEQSAPAGRAQGPHCETKDLSEGLTAKG